MGIRERVIWLTPDQRDKENLSSKEGRGTKALWLKERSQAVGWGWRNREPRSWKTEYTDQTVEMAERE